jgi:hypothetical protein
MLHSSFSKSLAFCCLLWLTQQQNNQFFLTFIGFQKGKEKVNEEAIAIHFVDPTEAPITDSKKKKQNKLEWELNRVYQNPWVARFF